MGVSVVHDASFMQQPGEGSQYGYMLLLGSTAMYDKPAKCHLLDWSSSKVSRKVRSTLAAEAASSSRAYDRATFLRYMMSEIEGRRSGSWKDMVQKVPCALATDCKSLYDLCKNDGKLPDERRVALDLLDVREGIQEFGNQFRWIPTDHMLADALTKRMPPDLLLKFLKDNTYCLKYDDVISNTKRMEAKGRQAAKKLKRSLVEGINVQKTAVKNHSCTA